MAQEHNPQFGSLEAPFIQEILTGRDALTPTQARSFGSMACLLTLTPSKFDEPLYNARYLKAFSGMLHPSAFIEADAVRQLTEEPELRDIAVEETVTYIRNITNDLTPRPLFTIPGGLKTSELISRELTRFESGLFNSMPKHFPRESEQFTHFDNLSPQEPLDFVPSSHPAVKGLREMHRISAESQRVLGQSACFLGLAVQQAPTLRFSTRYMHEVLKATRPKGRSIMAMQELACEPTMQELIAEEIDRYLDNMAAHAEPNFNGQLDIRIKNLPLVGRTRASTCNRGERDAYRTLFRQYGDGRPTGIITEQTLVVPGNGKAVAILEGYYKGIKASLLDAMNITYGLADQVS